MSLSNQDPAQFFPPEINFLKHRRIKHFFLDPQIWCHQETWPKWPCRNSSSSVIETNGRKATGSGFPRMKALCGLCLPGGELTLPEVDVWCQIWEGGGMGLNLVLFPDEALTSCLGFLVNWNDLFPCRSTVRNLGSPSEMWGGLRVWSLLRSWADFPVGLAALGVWSWFPDVVL